MARDCPDRQRGSDARNNVPGGFGAPQRRIGGGDAVDREMENLMQELSGNPSGNGPAGHIEAAPGMYDQAGYGGASAKPWERQPTGGAAPWQRPREERGGYDQGAGAGAGAAPWQQSRPADNYGAAPPPPGGAPWQQQAAPGHGYAAYGAAPGYDQGGYGAVPGYDQGYGAAPGYDQGYGAPPAAPPGLSDFLQQYGQAPPPPPGDQPPPPPSHDAGPPPPPGYDQPPPPPPA